MPLPLNAERSSINNSSHHGSPDRNDLNEWSPISTAKKGYLDADTHNAKLNLYKHSNIHSK